MARYEEGADGGGHAYRGVGVELAARGRCQGGLLTHERLRPDPHFKRREPLLVPCVVDRASSVHDLYVTHLCACWDAHAQRWIGFQATGAERAFVVVDAQKCREAVGARAEDGGQTRHGKDLV